MCTHLWVFNGHTRWCEMWSFASGKSPAASRLLKSKFKIKNENHVARVQKHGVLDSNVTEPAEKQVLTWGGKVNSMKNDIPMLERKNYKTWKEEWTGTDTIEKAFEILKKKCQGLREQHSTIGPNHTRGLGPSGKRVRSLQSIQKHENERKNENREEEETSQRPRTELFNFFQLQPQMSTTSSSPAMKEATQCWPETRFCAWRNMCDLKGV